MKRELQAELDSPVPDSNLKVFPEQNFFSAGDGYDFFRAKTSNRKVFKKLNIARLVALFFQPCMLLVIGTVSYVWISRLQSYSMRTFLESAKDSMENALSNHFQIITSSVSLVKEDYIISQRESEWGELNVSHRNFTSCFSRLAMVHSICLFQMTYNVSGKCESKFQGNFESLNLCSGGRRNLTELQPHSDIGCGTIETILSHGQGYFSDNVNVRSPVSDEPTSTYYLPVFSPNNTIVAIISASFSWNEVLRRYTSHATAEIIYVLSTPLMEMSFLLQADSVKFLGVGDKHDLKYNAYAEEFSTNNPENTASSPSLRVRLYPTSTLYSQFITDTAAVICAAFVVILAVSFLSVVAYDRYSAHMATKYDRSVESSSVLTSMIEQELELKKQFVRYLSHEIRTPLSTVNMGLEVLRNELLRGAVLEEALEVVTDIELSVMAALELVNEFLLFDKISSDSLLLELADCNVGSIVEEALQPFVIQARQQLVNLCLNKELSASSLHPRRRNVCVDRHKVVQVVRNLISNALKFTPKQGSVTVRLLQDPTESAFLVEVSDTGAGISTENQSRLFKEIVQFDPGSLQEGRGSGIGMYSSYEIMKRHHGDLTVYSEGLGKGCTFTMKIPMKSNLSQYVPASQHSISVHEQILRLSPFEMSIDSFSSDVDHVLGSDRGNCKGAKMGKYSVSLQDQTEDLGTGDMVVCCGEVDLHRQDDDLGGKRVVRVLVVDDAASNRNMLCRMLSLSTTADFRCEVAADGDEAVEMVRRALDDSRGGESLFDAVIMDYSMPLMNGPDAVKVMREEGYKGLIVGVTGHMGDSERNNFIRSGADRVFVKPMDIQEFQRIVLSRL